MSPQSDSDSASSRLRRIAGELEFAYRVCGSSADDDDAPLVPVVPFSVEGPNGKLFPMTGIVDTGASRTLLPEDWAEPLGIQIADCQLVAGGTAGGEGEFHLSAEPLYLHVAERTIEVVALFGGYSEVLLGRDDFLSHFVLQVDHRAQRVHLKPYN